MTPLPQEMSIATLIFSPPAWPVLLSAAAVWMLMLEVVFLAGWIRTGRSAIGTAYLTAASLLAGPIVAVAVLVRRIYWADEHRNGATLAVMKSSLHGTLIAISAGMLIARFVCGATSVDISLCSLAIIGWCMIAWSIRSYSRSPSPRRWRLTLVLMRAVAIVLAIVWVASPTMQSVSTEQIRSTVLIGIDVSSSMRRADMPAKYTDRVLASGKEPARRIDIVRQSVDQLWPALKTLAETANVRFFTFAGDVVRTSDFADKDAVVKALALNDASGTSTAIGDSVRAAADRQIADGKSLSNIIIVSDGCNNSAASCDPGRLAMLMSSRDVAIHTVGVGATVISPSQHSLSVKSLSAPDKTSTFTTMTFQPSVEAIGLAGRKIKIICSLGDQEPDSQEIEVTEDRQVFSPSFSVMAMKTGFQRLTAKVELLGQRPRELAGRESVSKLIHVQDRQMRVLYVEGRFRYESRYISDALSSGGITVDRRFLLHPQGYGGRGDLSSKLDDWLTYHAIIIGDISSTNFSPDQLEIIKTLVGKYGKGIVMIGGSNSYAAGGWGNTPLADVMPVDLSSSSGQISELVKVLPTADGIETPTMRLSDGDVMAGWEKFCPLLGANRLSGVKPAAMVWARAGDVPMIVVQQYGKGHSIAIAFDTTYQWAMSPDATGDMQKRFWRQIVMYLSDTRGNIWVGTDKAAYDQKLLRSGAEIVNVSAGIEDAGGKPIRSSDFTVTLSGPGISSPIPVGLVWNQNNYVAKLTIPAAVGGTYTLLACGKSGDNQLSAEHQFDVADSDAESFDLLADYQMLGRMSEVSGGNFVPLAEFGSLLDGLTVLSKPGERQVTTNRSISAALAWPVAIVFILLLCAEWFLRKKKGMI